MNYDKFKIDNYEFMNLQQIYTFKIVKFYPD